MYCITFPLATIDFDFFFCPSFGLKFGLLFHLHVHYGHGAAGPERGSPQLGASLSPQRGPEPGFPRLLLLL